MSYSGETEVDILIIITTAFSVYGGLASAVMNLLRGMD